MATSRVKLSHVPNREPLVPLCTVLSVTIIQGEETKMGACGIHLRIEEKVTCFRPASGEVPPDGWEDDIVRNVTQAEMFWKLVAPGGFWGSGCLRRGDGV